MDEMTSILEAVKTGGSAATLALAYFGWKLFNTINLTLKEQLAMIHEMSERLARFEGKMDARDDRNENRGHQ